MSLETDVPPTKHEKLISLLLRIDAFLQFAAVGAVLMPFAWMGTVHEWLGLGRFPDEPIVEYLARSLSAFYLVHGVITFVIAGDVRRYRPLIRVWALSFIAMGVVTIAIDVVAGLPLFWTLSEGPFVIVFGLVILRLLDRQS